MLQLSLSVLSLLLLEGDGVGELLLFNLVVAIADALILFVISLSLLDK